MANKKSPVAGRAWRLLRLALLWARKGGAFRRELMLDLRTVFRSIRAHNARAERIGYCEREFSFDETPLFTFKMHRPASKRLSKIPCITPAVDDLENDDDWVYYKKYFAEKEAKEEEYLSVEESEETGELEEDEEGIDSKAEEFIARFYGEMKFERQVSLLEYDQMLYRGIN
ncbi:uncharacterized protein LOC109849849 [Asparagus officinalis]|uniref:uncharacterized protein LOC109849849 n=1 Tax=Asparagus officinalis TaxID=4686 RepID=UPI00098E62F5|nr:uncharacterized protein LOC109849849 [Asparagus officinalis]